MKLARLAAVTLAFVALAASRPMHDPELATAGLRVNAVEPRTALIPIEPPPFRCDSARARDCFEMYQRHTNKTKNAFMTVASAAMLERVAPPTLVGSEPAGCLLDTGVRADRCPLRSGR